MLLFLSHSFYFSLSLSAMHLFSSSAVSPEGMQTGAIFRLKRASRLQDNNNYYKGAVSKDFEVFFINGMMPLSRICARVQNQLWYFKQADEIYAVLYRWSYWSKNVCEWRSICCCLVNFFLIACIIIFKFSKLSQHILYRNYVQILKNIRFYVLVKFLRFANYSWIFNAVLAKSEKVLIWK